MFYFACNQDYKNYYGHPYMGQTTTVLQMFYFSSTAPDLQGHLPIAAKLKMSVIL